MFVWPLNAPKHYDPFINKGPLIVNLSFILYFNISFQYPAPFCKSRLHLCQTNFPSSQSMNIWMIDDSFYMDDWFSSVLMVDRPWCSSDRWTVEVPPDWSRWSTWSDRQCSAGHIELPPQWGTCLQGQRSVPCSPTRTPLWQLPMAHLWPLVQWPESIGKMSSYYSYIHYSGFSKVIKYIINLPCNAQSVVKRSWYRGYDYDLWDCCCIIKSLR